MHFRFQPFSIQRKPWLPTIVLCLTACSTAPPFQTPTTSSSSSVPDGVKVGLILVGPKDDSGWSQAHYDGMVYVTEQVPTVTFDYVDKVNPADRPNIQASQVADDLITNGADLVIFNSDDHKDDALATAQKYPDVAIIHATGDYAWKDGKSYKAQPNLSNVMLQMEYGRMITGCAAALSTQTGKIGFLGPLINDETRRLVSATYLGARHCWQNYRGQDLEDLTFQVIWIGFWFNIPGVTLDPTQVADSFFNNDFGVVMTGIDTPEVAIQAKKAYEAGKEVRFLHYTSETGCEFAPEICLGVPTYNWGPSYLNATRAVIDGTFQGEFIWAEPDWSDLNHKDTSAIGFIKGEALTDENRTILDTFITGLGDGSLNLYQGPLRFQDGTLFVAAGETATPSQIWYMPQLLEGIEGASE